MGALVHKTGKDKLNTSPTSFFDLKAKDIEGNLIDFGIYKGKKAILVVNVACKWGLTSSNYQALTKMHEELADKGF